jgi:hypothetical protein
MSCDDLASTSTNFGATSDIAGIAKMESGAPRIAIVHEWLITYAGSEKVLEAMLQVFPDADVFCALDFLPEQFRGGFRNTKIKTSFVQRIPFARHIHRYLLALMPLAVEQHDLSGYDIVISNSHAVAKGCLTSAGQLHICYFYTPIRYAWDLQFQYLAESNLVWGLRSIIARWTLHKIRIWDARTPLLFYRLFSVHRASHHENISPRLGGHLSKRRRQSFPARRAGRRLLCHRLSHRSLQENSSHHQCIQAYAMVPSGTRLEFGVARSPGRMRLSFQAARSIG